MGKTDGDIPLWLQLLQEQAEKTDKDPRFTSFEEVEEEMRKTPSVKDPVHTRKQVKMSPEDMEQEIHKLQINQLRLERKFQTLASAWRTFRAEAKAGKFGLDTIFNNVHEQIEAQMSPPVPDDNSPDEIQRLLKKLEASGFSVVKTDQLASMEQRLKQVEDKEED